MNNELFLSKIKEICPKAKKYEFYKNAVIYKDENDNKHVVKENKDDVLFKTKGREFTINKNDVSLESFREKSKIIAPMISHKAEKAKDFNEILMKQHEQKKIIKL